MHLRLPTFLLLLAVPFLHAQAQRTFTIEDLERPDHRLPVAAYPDILKDLIQRDVGLTPEEIAEHHLQLPFRIIACSRIPDSMVTFGYHPFFNGMYQAYADHRPFVLSPDMIWLLIAQGFALHVINNAEALRDQLVHFNGKQTLIVQDNRISLDDPDGPWEEVLNALTGQIAENTDPGLLKTLIPDFSTTTVTDRVAAQITAMESMQPYFDFVVIVISCGIPGITLEGSPADWQRVREKTRQLRKYRLGWWVDGLDPVLKEFVNASGGHIDTAFWRDMFKYHTKEQYGNPKVIDGWIVRFFPYDKNGKRMNLKEIGSSNQLPNEIAKVDLRYLHSDNSRITETPLELWAGFVGLRQNNRTLALRPQIGWMVRVKDTSALALKGKLGHPGHWGRIQIRVKEVPPPLLALKEIPQLEISFIDSIRIPDEMGKIKIGKLQLHGKITETEIRRIVDMFPNTLLSINDKVRPPKARTPPAKTEHAGRTQEAK
ncbi:DUF4419 domain-containing protein [Compostibacter hankyongensis]|uniref:DUF4419 domain-containing protein n=1 Tax=Compostibacter hankyongensis TaxID=1007089 RepID=A0ABP8G2Z3_9BACT